MTNESGTALVERKDDRALSAFSSGENFQTAQRMARALTASSLVPKEYQGEKGVANTLIAMELANRIGASPLMVMQNLDIIHGRPSWRSQFLIATVNSSGRFSPLRFRFEGEEGKQTWGCRAYATDRETGDECEGTLITMAMAKQEGWSTKSGSKWATMPEQMLRYRAAAFWARIYAPELSLGMYTAEEIQDIQVAVGGVRSQEAQDLNAALEEEGVQVAEVVDEVTGEIVEPDPEKEGGDGWDFAQRDMVETARGLMDETDLDIDGATAVEEAIKAGRWSTVEKAIAKLQARKEGEDEG